MTTATLQNVWQTILGYDLSASNKRWLADQLNALVDKEEENLRPYTMEEVNAMLDEAEAEIAAGKGTPNEEVMREMDEEIERWEQEDVKLEMSETL